MKYFVLLLSVGLLFAAACSENGDTVVPKKSSLPTPTLEDAQPVSNTEATYFMLWNSFDEGKPPAQGKALLEKMLEQGIQPKDVWFPSAQTPCGAPGAVTVVVVELSKPDLRILGFGFSADPEDWWIINCGVAKLWHYAFE